MKRGYLLIFLILSIHAQQHDERVVGTLVTVKDRSIWKKIEDPAEIQKDELVAAYSAKEKDWLYAEVKIAPAENFSGLACFVPNGLFYNFVAINFESNVRKLLTEEEIAIIAQQNKSKNGGCLIQ